MKFFPRQRILPNLAPGEHAYFHCVSRIVDRRLILGSEEKDKFVQLMRRYEAFCKVKVLGYCVMDNHFHLIVRIPARPETRPSLATLLAHVQATLGKVAADVYRERVDFWQHQTLIGAKRNAAADLPRDQEEFSPVDEVLHHEVDLESYARFQLEKVAEDIWRRLYSVSQYLFSLKNQFSHWYNKKNERVGTLWEERFRATVIQPGLAVAELAAYVDLNPVRVGVVANPADYPWCQFSSASSGDFPALESIRILEADVRKSGASRYTERTEIYRSDAPGAALQVGLKFLWHLQYRRNSTDEASAGRLAAVEWEACLRHWPDGCPRFQPVDLGRRPFTSGVAVGDSAFLAKVFREHHEALSRKRRREMAAQHPPV